MYNVCEYVCVTYYTTFVIQNKTIASGEECFDWNRREYITSKKIN